MMVAAMIPTNVRRAVLATLMLGMLAAAPGWSQVDNLRFVGHDETITTHLMHAEVVGTRLYISEGLGSGGMETYDISNPGTPLRVDEDGPSTWRTRAYPELGRLFGFSHLTGVQIYDISGPTTTLLGGYDPPPGIGYEGGALRGTTLYVAAHQIGIQILDVDLAGTTTPGGTIDLGNNAAWDAEVLDRYLYVANGRFGLAVVDLDAVPPVKTADIILDGLANDVLIDGNVAYVSLGPDGLASLSLDDPAHPALLDHNRETEGNVTEISVLGNLLVAGAWLRLETYDISDPANIVRVGAENTKTWAMGADFNDDPGNPLIGLADWRGISTYRPVADLGADIDAQPPHVDFGTIAAARDTLVHVYNRGSATLHVTNTIAPSGISVSPVVFDVPSGGSQTVTITASGTASTRGSVRYLSNDPDEPTARQFVYKNNSATFPEFGSQAPNFTLLGSDGLTHSLSGQLGKVVFLEFGANW